MAGHSKWANIKHKKGAADKKKGKIFSRITKEIMVAAREGGGDPDANPRLRTALTAAKSANMPNANVERAIKKGTGEIEGETFEELNYEGYGAGGVAVYVECLSDNKNRTASEIRTAFDRNCGNLAGVGAVTWMFHRKAQFVITGENADEDKLMELLIDAGAEDISVSDGVAEVMSAPECFVDISKALETAGIPVEESGIIYHPENTMKIEDEKVARQVLRLIEKLEDQDDVQAVYSNLDIADDIMMKISEEAI
jgi:YebC/PmpR family DNA-binding regulatory protein